MEYRFEVLSLFLLSYVRVLCVFRFISGSLSRTQKGHFVLLLYIFFEKYDGGYSSRSAWWCEDKQINKIHTNIITKLHTTVLDRV